LTIETIAKSRYEYGRHETFAVRHSWLGKGLDRMEASPDGFRADDDAVVELGLGSRMVKSLRYWLEATGLADLRAVEEDNRKLRQLHTRARAGCPRTRPISRIPGDLVVRAPEPRPALGQCVGLVLQ